MGKVLKLIESLQNDTRAFPPKLKSGRNCLYCYAKVKTYHELYSNNGNNKRANMLKRILNLF